MYWIGFVLLSIVVIFLFIGLVIFIKDNEDVGGLFILFIIFTLVLIGYSIGKTYDESIPKIIQNKDISIMKDKDVAIIRYKEFQETYDTKKEYDAISDSSFVLKETIYYNIYGGVISNGYELIIK